MIQIDFSKEEVQNLYKLVLEHPHSFVRGKAFALLLKSFDRSTKEISELMDVCENTVCAYLKGFLQERMSYILVVKFYKPKSRLELYKDLIGSYLIDKKPQTIKQACMEIEQIEGLNLKQTQIRKHLNSIGWSVAVDRIIKKKKTCLRKQCKQ